NDFSKKFARGFRIATTRRWLNRRKRRTRRDPCAVRFQRAVVERGSGCRAYVFSVGKDAHRISSPSKASRASPSPLKGERAGVRGVAVREVLHLRLRGRGTRDEDEEER